MISRLGIINGNPVVVEELVDVVDDVEVFEVVVVEVVDVEDPVVVVLLDVL